MYGYEFEIQRQRIDRLQAEAENHRLLNRAEEAPVSALRRTIGRHLVKLGLRLQGEAQPVPTFAAA